LTCAWHAGKNQQELHEIRDLVGKEIGKEVGKELPRKIFVVFQVGDNVRFTPKSRHWNSIEKCPLYAKSGHCCNIDPKLFDHFVGLCKQGLRDVKTQCLRGREVEAKLKFRWLLNRQVAWFGAFQNLVNVNCRVAAHLYLIGSDSHQRASIECFF
jgi:hypothetical protein